MALGQLARQRKRCHTGSRRYRTLQATRRRVTARKRHQLRDVRHKDTRAVIACCQHQGVGCLFIGNPDGVRSTDSGRHHHQRMAHWESGQDRASLTDTAKLARIERFTGPERGTASRCPAGGWKQKVRGRVWRGRNPNWSFVGHRDVVGSVNRHPLAFGKQIDVPAEAHVSTAWSLTGPSPE